MLHPQGTHKGCISFNNNVVLLAKGRDIRPGVEGMHLNLIDRRCNPRLRIDKLLQLQIR
jgi:hypothetical protein